MAELFGFEIKRKDQEKEDAKRHEDAKQKLDAGADLVQVWTGFLYEGPAMVRRMLRSL